MLKFGVVAMGVTAGLVALAPLASAEDHGSGGSCSFTGGDAGDNNNVQGECSSFGRGNFEGNTFNDVPVDNPLDVFSNDVPIQDENLVNGR